MASTAVEVLIALTAKDAASAVLSNVTSKFQGLGVAAKVATAVIAATATAVVGTVTSLTALAVKSAAAAGEVAKLKRETGLTAEEASKFRVIGERMGLGIDDLSKSFGILSKSLESTHPSLAKYNIEVVKAKDGHVLMAPTLSNIAERFKSMPDGVEKTALALDIFGRSGKDMIPFLNQGKDGLKALGDEAARLGLVFDDKALAAAKRFTLAQKDLGENIEGLKNKLGMAFLPVLADVSAGLLGLANAVLPTAMRWIENLTGTVKTIIGVFGDMKKAVDFKMAGGGDFLSSLIGPKAANDFMELLKNISAQWQVLWIFHIRPAIEWAQENIPPFWEKFKTAISNMWAIAKPNLDEMVKQLDGLKDKFDKLPPSLQHWAEATAAGVAIVKATGLDSIIQGWANALGNFAQGGASIGSVLIAMGASILVVIGTFLALTAAIGAVIYIGTHLDELDRAWTELSLLLRLEMAKVDDFVRNAWNGLVGFIVGKINDVINGFNELITAMNKLPGVNIPLISKIQIDLPNADNVENVLREIARNRTSYLTIYTNTTQRGGNAAPQAAGGDYMVGPSYGGPKLFWAGEAGDERATFTPVGKSGGGAAQLIHTHIYLNGREIADAVGPVWTQDRRNQGLA